MATKTASQWIQEGRSHNNGGRPAEAMKCFDEALVIDPNCGEAYYYKGYINNDNGPVKIQEEINFYLKAISLGYKEATVYYCLGVAYRRIKKVEEALEAYNNCLAQDPKHDACLFARGNTLMVLGRFEEAIASIQKAIDIDPKVDRISKMGMIQHELGRTDEAIKSYDQTLARFPNNIWANLFKANILCDRGKHQEALAFYKASLSSSPNYARTCYHMALCYIALGNQEEAIKCYNAGILMKPTLAIDYCNKGKCFNALGRKQEAIEEFKKTKELLETDPSLNYAPATMKFMLDTLKSVLEAEQAAVKTEEEVKKLDQSNPAVMKFMTNIKKLQERKNEAQEKVLNQMDKNSNTETEKNITDLNDIKLEFDRQLSQMREEMARMKTQIITIDKKVTELQNNFDEMKEELDNKMDNFFKKLTNAFNKEDISQEHKDKLIGYFKAFVETFSSIHVTSQVIDSGQVQLDAGNRATTILSTLASFAPFVGSTLQSGVQAIGEFLQSKEMKTNARKMKGLAPDATQLSQVVGEAAYRIAMDKDKRRRIVGIADVDLREKSDNLFRKLMQICDRIDEKIDVYLYGSMYKTAAERYGHNDANELIELWIKGSITPFGIQDRFVEEALKDEDEKQSKTEASSPGSGKKTQPEATTHTACCTIF